MNFDLDTLDLPRLTEQLHDALRHAEPEGYLRGKSLMRDVLMEKLGLSEYEAEELVDTLEVRGYLQFLGDPQERSEATSHWDFNPH